MRFYTETTNGPSPGITIAGSKEDLAMLGNSLSKAVCSTPIPEYPNGSIRIEDMEIHGDPWDWIVFKVDPNVDRVIEERMKKLKKGSFSVTVVWSGLLLILVLAVKGVISFFY
jgi:hypothetical protein